MLAINGDIEKAARDGSVTAMFEMLRTFSIRDYFRDEAITWAYELLTSPEWL